MVIFFQHGFECPCFGACAPLETYAWSGTQGAAVCQSAVVIQGNFSAKFTVPPLNANAWRATGWQGPPLNYRFYVLIDQAPDLNEELCIWMLWASGTGWICYVTIYNQAGTLKWRLHIRDLEGGLLTFTSIATLSLNTKYCVEVQWVLDDTDLYVNQTKVIDTSNGGDYWTDQFFAGEPNLSDVPTNTINIYMDCFIGDTVYIGCKAPPFAGGLNPILHAGAETIIDL